MKNTLSLVLTLLLLGAAAAAQTPPAARSTRRAGTISGRLTDTAGQPIPHAVIFVTTTTFRGRESRNTSTDEQGRFRVTDLARGVYFVSPNVPGYVLAEETAAPQAYRAGDTVSLTMAKGGAITGIVMSATNEPMTGCTVQAVRVRDKDGRPLASSRIIGNAQADDRGVYRVYGLPSGTYLVFAGKPSYSSVEGSVYRNDMPTYYPSSTRDTAQPVIVQVGGEASGIDIRYRGERGHAISGKVVGMTTESTSVGFQLVLHDAASGATEGQAYVGATFMGGFDNSFAFYGLADGEYVITAITTRFEGKAAGGSGRTRVRVKGADVTGTEITVLPYGALAGTLVIEPLHNAEGQSPCEVKRRLMPDEMLVRVRPEKRADNPVVNYFAFQQNVPSDKGEFALTQLEAGSYRVEPAMLGEDYFVKSITLPAPGKNQPPVDAARAPLTIKAGERLADLTVTVAEGAAAVTGHVIPATDGARLPDRLRVHLVPAEKEAANDRLRFAEARVNADGSFAMNNLAPGHYFVVARPPADQEASDEAVRPAAWDAAERATLLKEAAAANVTLDLQSCQRRRDYAIKYAPPAPKPARNKNQ
jgi:Carboxypeptidase regulatory-like domain